MNTETNALVVPLLLAGLLACSTEEPAPNVEPSLPPVTQFADGDGEELATAWSPDGKWIAFATDWSGNRDIWKKPADGSGEPIQLTDDPALDMMPAWSPDGSRIAFSSDRGGTGHIWTMSASGGDLERITADDDSVAFDSWNGCYSNWSPDGQWIAFVWWSEHSEEDIYIIPSRGGATRPLVRSPERDDHPEWSPDGKEIAFSSERDGQFDIWITPASGGPPRQVTTNPADDGVPAWSPDGSWLVFQSNRGGAYDIWVIPATGGEARRITDTHDMYVPRWSPDGRSISFHQTTFPGELWVMPAEGGRPQRLLDRVPGGGQPAWSPDAREIAFIQRGTEGELEIWRMAASGGDAVQVTWGAMVHTWWPRLSWSPDGKQLAFESIRGGDRDIWTVPLAGGEPDRVTVTSELETRGQSWSPDGDRIVYAIHGEDEWALRVVPASGGPAENLFSWEGYISSPKWSPDGEKIAFVSSLDRHLEETGMPSFNVWVLTIESGETEWLCEGFSPSWSPDGTRLCFVQGFLKEENNDIWTIPASGGEPTRLLQTPDIEETLTAWSPDGERILFTTASLGASDIWIADVSGMFDRK